MQIPILTIMIKNASRTYEVEILKILQDTKSWPKTGRSYIKISVRKNGFVLQIIPSKPSMSTNRKFSL